MANEPAAHETDVSRMGAVGTGLRQASGCEQPKGPSRTGTVWKCISVLTETANPYQPKVRCNFCGHTFSGTAARIEQHMLGGGELIKCRPSKDLSEEARKFFSELLGKLQEVHAEKQNKKERKRAAEQSNTAATENKSMKLIESASSAKDSQIARAFDKSSEDEIDNTIADFFYGCNVDFNLADHPLWKKMVQKLRAAPQSYKPPHRRRLANDLLQKRTEHYHNDLFGKLQADAQFGLTVVCDGWDQCDGEHLINLLAVGRTRVYFLGTVEISSSIAEDAPQVAKTISTGILQVGPINCVQVVTDTCTTMKAAWRIVEKQFPWVTCSSCMPHVLNLLLKDISKTVDAISNTIAEGEQIVNWFRNKKLKGARWRRKKLKEVTEAEMGNRAKALMRPAPTRFCAYTYMLARILEVKAALRRTVVSEDYTAKKFDENEGGDPVVEIILSSSGPSFWKRAESVVSLTAPVIRLLRRLDSNSPLSSKVYKAMYSLKDGFTSLGEDEESKVPEQWAEVAASKAEERWEYGHSPFHAAGYALDPEYQKELSEMGLDAEGLEPVKEGLEKIVKRMALRLELQSVQPELAQPFLEEMPTLKVLPGSHKVSVRVADFFLDYSTYLSPTGPMAEDFVQLNAKRLSAADFWALHLSHLRHASQVAKVIVSQICAASHAERNWKAYGRIKTPARCKLQHEKADKRVFLYNVLHQKERLKDANFRPVVPEWDDVSSDESEDGFAPDKVPDV